MSASSPISFSSFNNTDEFPEDFQTAVQALKTLERSRVMTAQGKFIDLPQAYAILENWVKQACMYVEHMREDGHRKRDILYVVLPEDYNKPTSLAQRQPISEWHDEWIAEYGRGEGSGMQLHVYLGQVFLECENEIYLRENYPIDELPTKTVTRIRDKVKHVIQDDILLRLDLQHQRPLPISQEVQDMVQAFQTTGGSIEDAIPDYTSDAERDAHLDQMMAQFRAEQGYRPW